MESGGPRADDFSGRFQGNGIRPIQGMESVVATVSGYHGTERFKLIKLIAQAGASYTGAMTKSTTHLVCWQFEGKKYDMARRTGAHIISHCWFEDCLKERKRLPEDPYAAQSGQEAGPITWEVPASLDTSGKGKSIISTERCMLSDNFSALNCRNIVEIDASYLDWSDSKLLHKCKESSTFPKVCSSSKKRNLFDATQDVTCKPTRRSHRLKKKEYCNLLNYVSLGQKQGTSVKKFTSQLEIIDLDSTCENTARRRLGSSSQGKTMGTMFSDHEGSGIEGLEQDGVEELRNDTILSDNGIFSDNEHFECIGKMLGSSENARNDNEHHKEGENLYEPGAFKQAELSCVICWTEFSTTRAVLPCGHRFCYSCIQGWVDCLASRGKISLCPLCKSSFTSMRKMDTSTDQKIYSQTIPSESSTVDIIMASNNGNDSARASMSMDPVCSECHNREPEDLLLCCGICQSQWVHSYCLDPPVSPWTCIHCRDLRTLYQRFR
ncbi:BRCA1 C Terminus (BRCT) domain [Musa troglodytarum]|uniref:BRCA1 C Terminus (BRCT) domain n=1 Tax=Musa troglodytarum TaxID=320322 RepID=A0A9E7K7X3_9LILI|nr:BRCA1 C Terminus (BRCT) domain [Musa troglodytarum]